jgi:hypothetical protein
MKKIAIAVGILVSFIGIFMKNGQIVFYGILFITVPFFVGASAKLGRVSLITHMKMDAVTMLFMVGVCGGWLMMTIDYAISSPQRIILINELLIYPIRLVIYGLWGFAIYWTGGLWPRKKQ